MQDQGHGLLVLATGSWAWDQWPVDTGLGDCTILNNSIKLYQNGV